MDNKIVTLAVTLVIGLILAGSVLMPIVDDAKLSAGDLITLQNNSSITLRDAEPGDVLQVVRTTTSNGVTDVWSLNGEIITTVAGGIATWDVGIISDGVYMQIFGASNSSGGKVYDMTDPTPTTRYFGGSTTIEGVYTSSFTFTDSEIVVKHPDGSTWSVGYTWAKVICPPGKGEYTAANPNGTGYVSDPSEVILCGEYSTGNNNTMYWLNGGNLVLSNPAYTGQSNIVPEIHEGTTDIYDVTVSVDVGGETFTPFRIYVPFEVHGHESSGSAYNLYGVIPVMVIVALLLFAVQAIRMRND